MIGYIEPAHLSQIIDEVAQSEVDRYESALKDALESGWAIWSIQSPSKRLHGYMNSTLHQDLEPLMNPDYLELYKGHILPQLESLTQWQQSVAMGNMEPAPQFFWGYLQILPPFIFKHFQRDLIDLMNTPAEKYLGTI